MSGACIKGTAFQAVVDDLQKLSQSGELGNVEVEKHLIPSDLPILRSGVLPGSWYAIDVYRRMLQLLVAVHTAHGSADRDAYLRRRGVAAAERILSMGLYNHLDAAIRAADRNPTRWIEQVGRVMTTLSKAMFNFSSWEFVSHETETEGRRAAQRSDAPIFTLNVSGARDLPEETRVLLEGFIASLFTPFTDQVVRVRGRRSSPDVIVYDGFSDGVPRRQLR